MEEIVKELREDKKRAWEMITSLNERLSRAEKLGKDEDLHCKIDKLLEKLEKQAELERKVDNLVKSQEEMRETMTVLSVKMNNSFVDVTKSKEMLKVIDTVETTEGYVELFVKDFDKIHGKLNEIEGQIENTRHLEQKLDLVVDQGRKVQDEVNGNKREISKLLLEIQKANERIESISELMKSCLAMAADIKCQNLDIDGPKQEMVKPTPRSHRSVNAPTTPVPQRSSSVEDFNRTTDTQSVIDYRVHPQHVPIPVDLRTVLLMKGSQGLGFSIIGGADGEPIYVNYVTPGGVADLSGNVRKGDILMAVNENDLREATHEQAAETLKNATNPVTLLLQYRPHDYQLFIASIDKLRSDIIQMIVNRSGPAPKEL